MCKRKLNPSLYWLESITPRNSNDGKRRKQELSMFCYSRFKSCNILHSNPLLNWLTILEKDHRWDRHDSHLTWSLRIVIDIVLCNNCLTFHLASKFFETRKHHLTWTTPFSPEINENKSCRGSMRKFSISRNMKWHSVYDYIIKKKWIWLPENNYMNKWMKINIYYENNSHNKYIYFPNVHVITTPSLLSVWSLKNHAWKAGWSFFFPSSNNSNLYPIPLVYPPLNHTGLHGTTLATSLAALFLHSDFISSSLLFKIACTLSHIFLFQVL